VFLFTDCVIEQIGKEIAAYLPERGGALLGPPASPLISVLLFDAQASVTGASYLPSGDLVRRVADMERTEGLQFKGVIHSHPGSSDKPSGQDCYAFRRGLDLNPGLAAFLAPIVRLDRPARSGRENEVAVTGSSRMTVYAAYRAPIDVDRGLGSEWYPRLRVEVPARELVIDTPPCQVIPVGAHTAELTAMLGQRGELVGSVRWGTLAFNGAHFLSASFVITANEVIVLFPPTYPISKPAILVTKIDEDRANDTKGPSRDKRAIWAMRIW
jgi:hypothetical protein